MELDPAMQSTARFYFPKQVICANLTSVSYKLHPCLHGEASARGEQSNQSGGV